MNKLSYRTKELAEVTGIDMRFWRLLRDLHILRPIRVGRSDIWDRREIEDFLEWARGRNLENETLLKRELLHWHEKGNPKRDQNRY